MRLFFDTNILLDQIDEVRSGHPCARRLEQLIEERNVSCLCAWHSLSIIDYIGGKKFGREAIHHLLHGLLEAFTIPLSGTQEAKNAFRYLNSDFEDALQIATAVAGQADYIVTHNPKDFARSPIPCLSCEEMCQLLTQSTPPR